MKLSDRLAFAACKLSGSDVMQCRVACLDCRRQALAVGAELATVLRERYGGSSGVADWLDGLPDH
jgi:hypothetical protein